MESVIVSDSGVSNLFSTYTSSMHGNPDGPFPFPSRCFSRSSFPFGVEKTRTVRLHEEIELLATVTIPLDSSG